MTESQRTDHHSSTGRAIAIGVVLALVVGLVVLAFSWPSVTSEPRDLPIGVVGPEPAVAQLESAIEGQAPGVFDLRAIGDRPAAVESIENREVYGAIVLGETPEVLTSTAASAVVAQQLAGMAAMLEARLAAEAAATAPEGDAPTDVRVTVTDVVPLDEDDPRGAGLASAVFPLVLGGVLGGVVIGLAVAGRARRLLVLGVYVVVAAAVLVAILQGWFGVLPGDAVAVGGVLALALLAIGATVVGLVGLLGRVGAALAAVTFVLLANPISSAVQPVEFLPVPWGAVGQWFPPGAAATLLRDVAYFPAADASFPWLVLAGWATLGLALVLLTRRAGTRP